ncbi:Hypothetical predicted protein [Olea europaea subsp. europaea]|uniref:Uncharacterized protein n=1 Tax=Olea europaea subsp. europaea TaxID=158383 RepID=A0A8S0R0E4_OLEEU|nr:Hypothetical predicted protein [Olea europaea subsp. europaea]
MEGKLTLLPPPHSGCNEAELAQPYRLVPVTPGSVLEATSAKVCNGHQNVNPIRFEDLNNEEHDHQDGDAIESGFGGSDGKVAMMIVVSILRGVASGMNAVSAMVEVDRSFRDVGSKFVVIVE